jgi:hypothetical protein
VTPEQTTELLKALNQHNWFPVACGIIWLLGTILQFLIVAKFKSAIENKQHFSRLRYEREIELYREIWVLVHEFYFKSCLAFGWKISSDKSSEISEKPTKESWHKSREQLSRTIERNKPFYPSEIWNELNEFDSLCENLTYFYQENAFTPVQKRDAQKQAKAQYEKVEEAIRKRLAQFDNVN